jgi:hypothetical protein
MKKIQKSKVKNSISKGRSSTKLKKSASKKTTISSKEIGEEGNEEFVVADLNKPKASNLKILILPGFIISLGVFIYFSWSNWSFPFIPNFSIEQLKTKINSAEIANPPKIIDFTSSEQLEIERRQLKKSLSHLIERIKVIEKSVAEVKKLAQATIPPSEKPIQSTTLNVLNGRLKTLEKNNVTINKLLEGIKQIKEDEGKRKIKQAETSNNLKDNRVIEAGYQNPTSLNNPASLILAADNLREAIASNRPFNKPLDVLKNIAGEDLNVKTAILMLTKDAHAGIPSTADLKRQFKKISVKIIQASRFNESSDWKSRVINRLASIATWRRVDGKGVENPIDKIVAAVEKEIRTDNLKAAVITLKGLSINSKAAAVAETWLINSNKRIAADRAVNFLHIHALSKLTTSYSKKEQKR